MKVQRLAAIEVVAVCRQNMLRWEKVDMEVAGEMNKMMVKSVVVKRGWWLAAVVERRGWNGEMRGCGVWMGEGGMDCGRLMRQEERGRKARGEEDWEAGGGTEGSCRGSRSYTQPEKGGGSCGGRSVMEGKVRARGRRQEAVVGEGIIGGGEWEGGKTGEME